MEKKERTFCGVARGAGITFCVTLSVLAATVLFVSSCSEESRHKILTFFFEGVPPIGAVYKPAPLVGRRGRGAKESDGQAAKEGASQVSPQKKGSRHEPAADCNRCHAGQFGRDQRRLREPLPDLCYKCHTDYEAGGGNLHGPIAVGECLFCHESHQSRYIHLQKAPQPELCYRCHRREDMITIPGHEDMVETVCTDCHDPHKSFSAKLLKPSWNVEDDPNSVDGI